MIFGTVIHSDGLARAITMAKSIKKQMPYSKVVIGIMEQSIPYAASECPYFDETLLMKNTSAYSNMKKFFFQYTFQEAQRACKALLTSYIYKKYTNEDTIIYLDADTWVISPVDELTVSNQHPITLIGNVINPELLDLDWLIEGSLALVDGLVAADAPEVLVPAAERVRLVVLLHMPATGAADRERAVLAVAAAVVATSDSTRRLLIGRDALDPGAVHVAEPGVDPAPVAPGTTTGGALLSVAAVTPGKGHDVLLDALSCLRDLAWRCVCVGSLTRDPGWAARTLRQAQVAGLDDRVEFPGARVGPALAASYAGADALVLATRAESYGMVAAEALARGIPVIGSDVGGLPDTVGQTRTDACRGCWCPRATRPPWRTRCGAGSRTTCCAMTCALPRGSAADSLPPWAVTTDRVEAVLAGLLTGVAA